MGWGPKVFAPGDITQNSPAQLPLTPGNYDQFVITRDPDTQDITVVQCYRKGVLLATITLTYDSNSNLSEVVQT